MVTIDEFGSSLISDVRDRTLKTLKKMFSGKMNSSTAKKIQSLLEGLDATQLENVEQILSYAVDESLFNMLNLIESDPNIKLLYSDEDLTELSDGLAGELFADDGWISKFSKI